MEKPRSLDEMYRAFEAYRLEHAFKGTPKNLYEPMQYIMDLGGKRARPLLTISAAMAAGGQPEHAFAIGLAMEVFHNFTLVHDDIMDNALVRRGKPTVHASWNTPVAILSGDNLLVAAYTILHGLDCHKKHEIISLFNDTAREVCEGQQMDMDFAGTSSVSVPEYLEMIRLKTAVLLGCSAACGALSANADSERVKLYYRFAIALGMAFQLKDDYLDTFGDPRKTGKQAGGDIAEGKRTWLYLAALEADAAVSTIYAIEDLPERVLKATALFKHLELDQQLLALSEKYDKEAMECLHQLDNLGENISLLQSLTKMLAQRDS